MKRVLIGMSGGVDSSVAAILLKNQGYEVIGATMVLFDSDNQNVIEAKKICELLNIEHHTIDLKKEFKEKVINNFIETYINGKTPNPCIECNKYFKFGYLFDKAKELNCDFIATGHYAKIENGKLLKSDVVEKDQTYFLYKINKNVLNHIIFPLEKYKNKSEIREIAEAYNLPVKDKKDSQEICFIPNNDYTSYLEQNIDTLPPKGNFILKDGTVIGKHKGIMYYTIGQRKGLGISYHKPLYVTKIDKINNTIILGDEIDLYNKELIANNINLLVEKLPNNLTAKVRYRSNCSTCNVELINENEMKIEFNEPQKSITPGQSVVLYHDNQCIGGGIIKEII